MPSRLKPVLPHGAASSQDVRSALRGTGFSREEASGNNLNFAETQPTSFRRRPDLPGEYMKRIQILDSHTGGEPTRLVLDGFPDLGRGSMAERRQRLADEFDDWRAATVLEPRGSDVLVG